MGTFHVVAMPIAARQALVHAVESAGLDIIRLIYSLPASLASCWEAGWNQRRVLLVDVGGLATDLGYFLGPVLETVRILPRGGVTLATAMASELKISMDQAVTWSLEGSSCHRPEARMIVEHEWKTIQEAIKELLTTVVRPEAILLTGRGTLTDGFAEWLERTNGIPTTLGRPARLHQVGDLAEQVGFSSAMGLLELATRASSGFVPGSQPLLNRLLAHTRAILTEYF